MKTELESHDHILYKNGRMAGKVEYRRIKGQWRWTLISRNGDRVCSSSEGDGFDRLAKAKRNFTAARKLSALAE